MDNIFIRTYHMVRNIFTFPFRALNKNKKQKLIDEKMREDFKRDERLREERGENTQTNNNNQVKRTVFDYEIINNYGQTIKSSFDAYTESEVRAFLINEGYQVVSITPRSKLNMEIHLFGGKKINTNKLTFALTQVSTYVKAGIPLVDAIRILAKQTADKNEKKVYERIVYDLVTGKNFSEALESQNDVFPKLLINMVKTAEMTGDLPTVLDEMSDYYKAIEETRKQMITALLYPSIIFIAAIAVVTFCLLYVVPTFTTMYANNNAALPGITLVTLAMSNFVQNYWLVILILFTVVGITYSQSYKNIKTFRKTMQGIYMRIPAIGNIIIYNEVTMFTKTFASLINHNVNITQSMEVLSKISDNEIYKDIIYDTIDTLSRGGKISESFRGKWAFPIVAYEMLVTGENTGQLGLMMEKVAEHYESLHKNAVTAMKSLIEPMTIIFLAVCVGFILISMFIPMFDVYSTIT